MSIFNPQRSVKKWTLGALQRTGELTDQSIAGYDPFARTGTAAFGTLADSYGLGGEAGFQNALNTFQESPGYQFQLDQGINAIDRGAASRGMTGSGATLKALQGYGQGLANQEFGNWQRGLSGLSASGLGALGAQSALRNSQSDRIFGGYSNIGNAQAAQRTGHANMAMQGIGALMSAFGGGGGGGGNSAASLARLFMGG